MLLKTKKQDQILVVVSMANVTSISLEVVIEKVRALIKNNHSRVDFMPYHRGFGRSVYQVAKYLNGIRSKYKCFVFVGNVSPAVRIAAHYHRIGLACYFVGSAPLYDPKKGYTGEEEWALTGYTHPGRVE